MLAVSTNLSPHTGLVILLEPGRVGQRQLREHSLALHEVPRSSGDMQGHCINCDKVEILQLPDVVVPRYHSLHWIPHHIDIDWHVQIKPANKISNMYCAIVLNKNEKLFSHACPCVSSTKLIVFHAVNLGDAHSLCVLSCT